MSARHRELARRQRLEMIQRLGGKCVDCGTKGTKDPRKNPLEIDHIHGRDYDITKMDSSWRMVLYKREEKAGLLQVLCKRCNGKKGDPRSKVKAETETNEPVNEADPIVECPSCKGDGHWCGTDGNGEMRHYVCVSCSATFVDNIKTGEKTLDGSI